jgi:hypothetical protein
MSPSTVDKLAVVHAFSNQLVATDKAERLYLSGSRLPAGTLRSHLTSCRADYGLAVMERTEHRK